MNRNDIEEVLAGMTDADRRHLLSVLREKYKLEIHPLESQWNTTAEAILEAIHNASDLTQRGIRGVLAEATFRTVVLPTRLRLWRNKEISGDLPYDLMVEDEKGTIRVQVKLQRREKGIPKYFRQSKDLFVVETQRTRSGKRPNDEASRPYRVGEFDVLAVCLHPSTGDWTDFIYCANCDLRVRSGSPQLLEVLQPFPIAGSDLWSRDFDYIARRQRERNAGAT